MKNEIKISSVVSDLDENDREKVLFHQKHIEAAERTIFKSVSEMGRHLYEVKLILRNKKEFDQWVDETFGFKSRTAYNVISLWLMVKQYSSLQSLGKDALYYIASNNFPKQLLPILNDTKGEIPLKKKDLMVIKEQFENGKFDVLTDSIKASYQKSRQKHFGKIWIEKGKHIVKNLDTEIDGLKSTIDNQRNFLGAELVNGESFEIITKILLRAVEEIEDHLNEKSGRLKNAEKAEHMDSIVGDIAIETNIKTLDEAKIADVLEVTPQPSPDNQSEMELVVDNGFNVTNDAEATVEALEQLEHGSDNGAFFTNADDDGGLSADSVEKLLAVTEATPSPEAFGQQDLVVGGTDETTPVATEEHEYSATSNEKHCADVTEIVTVAGIKDEDLYSADNDDRQSDIIDISADDDETLEEKEEETSGAF